MLNLGRRFPDRQVGSNTRPFVVLFAADDGTPIDLTDAAITFRMVAMDVDQTVKIDDEDGAVAGPGSAMYQPTISDLDTAGDYNCQMTATLADHTVFRSAFYSLRILPNA